MNEQLIQKAKTAKTAQELLEMAKEAGFPLTEEQAAQAFEKLHTQEGEIADLELEGVSGGGCGGGKRVTGKRLGRTCPRCGNDCWGFSSTGRETADSPIFDIYSCAVCKAKYVKDIGMPTPPGIWIADRTLKDQPDDSEAWT